MGGAAVANDKNLTPDQKDALVGAREAIKERGESFSLPEVPASKISPSALTMAEIGAKFHSLPVPPYISEKTIERSVGYSDHPFRSSGTPEVTEALSLRKLYGPAPLGKTPGLADAMKELETILKEQRESGEKLSPAEQMRRANELLKNAREEQREALLSDISKRLSGSESIEAQYPGIAQKAVEEALSLRKLYGPAPLGKTPGLADAMKELETLLKEQRESGEKLSPAEQMRRANELLKNAREEQKEALLSDISKRLSRSGSIETENPGIAQKAIEAAKEAANMQPIVPTRVEEGDRYHVRRAEKWSSPKTIEITPSE